jgi:hypothetical protein
MGCDSFQSEKNWEQMVWMKGARECTSTAEMYVPISFHLEKCYPRVLSIYGLPPAIGSLAGLLSIFTSPYLVSLFHMTQASFFCTEDKN